MNHRPPEWRTNEGARFYCSAQQVGVVGVGYCSITRGGRVLGGRGAPSKTQVGCGSFGGRTGPGRGRAIEGPRCSGGRRVAVLVPWGRYGGRVRLIAGRAGGKYFIGRRPGGLMWTMPVLPYTRQDGLPQGRWTRVDGHTDRSVAPGRAGPPAPAGRATLGDSSGGRETSGPRFLGGGSRRNGAV